MERALNLESLAAALGEHPADVSSLPSPDDLQILIAEAEIRLFAGMLDIDDQLVSVAWYLHGVASASEEAHIYDTARQRRAFQVSAHIFDLALLGRSWTRQQTLRLAFAAQVGYHRGEQEPNAIAVWQRIRDVVDISASLLDRMYTLGLEAGVALLGLDRQRLFRFLRVTRNELTDLRQQIEIDSLEGTMFGAPSAVVEGVNSLLSFLAFGDRNQLETAQVLFASVVDAETSAGDLDSRWVAAHLRTITGEMEEGSVWSLLPPNLPPHAFQAMTLTDPPILTLWKPQRDLLKSSPSILSPNTRRVVLSLPTSAGKTLMAQLMIVTHLAASGTSVCYIAPMRSLGREIRRALRTRLVPLQGGFGRDLPDFFHHDSIEYSELLELLAEIDQPHISIDIVTPERLAHLLRQDAEGVLDKYGLFVFDEAHLLGEEGRGFTLETILTFLNWRTSSTRHRILLLSSALGNRGQLMSWLDPNDDGLLFESNWRGPRRLNALFNTVIERGSRDVQSAKSAKFPRRHIYPLIGQIRLRPADHSPLRTLRVRNPVGRIAFRVNAAGQEQTTKLSSHSTPIYKAVAQLIASIGHGGPVLAVVSTRVATRRMAQAIASNIPVATAAKPLADFVRSRLSDNHPLVEVINHGVAYHHAALPMDILEAIEDGVRDGQIHYIASTTSLTEGVNLPVRTVVIFETNYEGQPTQALLRGARLLNAIGRAGRACKECEGWVVLVRNQSPRLSDFDLLNVDADELIVTSRLTDALALESFAALEIACRTNEDALFEVASREAADFISFIWFMLTTEEERQESPSELDLDSVISSTLAHIQLNQPHRELLLKIAEYVRHVYSASDPMSRLRWTKTGTSIGSARQIDVLAAELAEAALHTPEIEDVDKALALLRDAQVVDRLIRLPEAPKPWRFRLSASGSSQEIDVDIGRILHEWVHGMPIADIADRHLSEVPNHEYRIEQMVDAVTQHFEHFLSWTVGAVIAAANQRLSDEGSGMSICESLPLLIRYGVDSDQAIELLTAGVRSREFASGVARTAILFEVGPSELQSWIRDMSIADWRHILGASAADVLDLLEYARIQGAGLLRQLLEDGEVAVELDEDCGIDRSVDVLVEPAGNEPLSQLVAKQTGESEPLAHIPTRFHAEVQAILDTGLSLHSVLNGSEVRLTVLPDEI